MNQGFVFPIDIQPCYYAAIGEVAARWSWLEHRLAVLIREGFKVDKAAGRAMTASMNASTLTRTMGVLTTFDHWIKDKGMREELAQFVKDVEKLRDRRNELVHGVYGPTTDGTSDMYRIRMKSGASIIEPDGVPITLMDLEAFAVQLRRVQQVGNDLSDRLKISQREGK